MTIETYSLKGLSLVGFSDGASSGDSRKAVNPRTGKEIEPPFFSPSNEEIAHATERAWQAFLGYSKKSGAARADFLEEIAKQIEAIAPEITERAILETGLPEPRFKAVEIPRTCNQLRLFARMARDGSWTQARIDTALPDRQPLPKADIRSMLRPLGPVAVFAASNFPLAFSVAGGDTASALAAGCPVIVKAHSSHPGVSELVGRAVLKAARLCDMPDGVFSLLFGSGRTVGAALVKDHRVKAVGFTGSTTGGTSLMKLASERPEPIPVYAEMGSINPLVILPQASAECRDAIASGLQISATIGVGQFCTKPGLVLVKQDEDGDRLVKAFADKMSETPEQVMLNSGIQKAYCAEVGKRQSDEKVKDLLGFSTSPEGSGRIGTAAVFETDAATYLAKKELGHEMFGPGLMVVRWKDQPELRDVLENLEGQLTGTIHSDGDDLSEHPEVLAILERKVGRIIHNGFPTGVEVCPSMVHGGPFPATSDGRSTSVGTHAATRFTRLIAYQSSPQSQLPEELKDGNPLNLMRLVDGEFTRK